LNPSGEAGKMTLTTTYRCVVLCHQDGQRPFSAAVRGAGAGGFGIDLQPVPGRPCPQMKLLGKNE